MAAYAIVDVEIYDIAQFLEYQKQVSPLLQAAGALYLARGGEQRVYEGEYEPRRLILVQFPSLVAMDAFYESEGYQALQGQRKSCCECQVLGVEGLD